ncbi:MAG: hypothetical protein CR996_00920 [Draconibacterium sp.]|nr:MAG: hypothetical protein CR996_00920 [Draconibacterium sp.]PIF06276.1 MAG: hypothetical protein CSA36_02485 [Draconibacterium sp.]
MRKGIFNIIFFSGCQKALLPLLLLFSTMLITAQEKKMVEILQAGVWEASEQIGPNATRLVDSVLIKHKEILMWCDTAYTYSTNNQVDAFGHVHIKQGDTLHLYSDAVMYDGDKNFARAWGNVVLKNKSTTIYTDTLDYDIEQNISYYDDSGKIVDSTTTITSIIGKYFINNDIIYLYRDVTGENEKFTLESDTINYNTETGVINIQGPTTIRDSANTLYAEKGWYNSVTGEAELLKKPVISNETQRISAKYIQYNKENQNGIATGNVIITDTENQSIITGQWAEYNDNIGTALVTDSAVYMNYNESDTLFLHADTLRMVPDTLEGEKVVTAYYKVRFFRTNLQGIADSMAYFTHDSLIQLYTNPVIWSEIHQLSADYIEMKQYTDAPDELRMIHNSFIISKQDSGRYDQIKGKLMTGFITNRKLTNIDVDGNGETLYYAREKENIIGVNRAESSKIAITFKDGEVNRIIFLNKPEGQLKPLKDLTEEDKKLKGFDWKIYLRPLSKYDIFEQKTAAKKKEVTDKQKKADQSEN